MKTSHRLHRNYFRTIGLIGVICGCLAVVRLISAQSGVLIPSTDSKPDSTKLSLNVMNVDVLIDNQHARVKVLQIFDNHTSQVLEGKCLFALPPTASIFDFAVWDADTRIPVGFESISAPQKPHLPRAHTGPGVSCQGVPWSQGFIYKEG